MSPEIPRRHKTRGHSSAMSAALVPLLLQVGLANAQAVSVPSGCPSVLTLTVLPSDYSGSLLNLPTSLWPSLPTFSLPSLPSLSLPDLSITVPPITGLPSLALPTLNPSATLDVPTISLPLSAVLPTIPLPSGTPVSYTCEEADNKIIVQNGLAYAVDCGATAVGTVYSSVPAVGSFNDCFQQCDRSSSTDGAKYCTGFSYDGAADGEGAGTCYLSNSVQQGFTAVQSSGRIAAVRLLNYIAGGNVPLSTLLPTNLPITTQLPGALSSLLSDLGTSLPSDLSVTQLPGAISSLLSELGTNLPTDLPITTQLPGAISSLLSDLGTVVPSNLPITTELPGALSSLLSDLGTVLPSNLPATEIPGAISSLLAGASTDLPNGVSSLLNDLTSGLTLPTDLPITTVLPNGVTSILSQLSNLPTNLPSLTISLPTELPTDLLPTLSLPSGSLPTLSISLPTALPTISIPGVGLPTISNILPTTLPSGIIPPISVPGLSIPQGTNLLSTTDANGLPTMVPITPSVVAPSLTVSLPTDLSLSGIPVLTNYLTTTGLGGVTTVIPMLSTLSLSIPSLSISAPSISVPSLSLPTLSLSLPTLSVPSVDLSTLSLSLSIPTVSVPSLAIPTLSTLSISVPALSVPTLSVPSLSAPSLSIPTLSVPALSLSAPTLSISVPSLSISVPSLPASIPTNILPSLSLPGGALGSASTGNPLVAPTATAVPIFGCPFDSGLAYVSPAGQAFMITCSTNSLGYDIGQALQPNLESCVNSCGNVQGCTSAVFQASTQLCSYKSQNGQSIGAGVDFSTAVAIDLSCPNGNGVVYMDAYGSNYQILCNYTFPSRTEITQSAVPSGRLVDERSLELEKRAPGDASFLACSVQCSALSSCVAVTQTNGYCIFISSLGPAGTGSTVADTVILVAKRIVTVDANGVHSTSTSTAASVPTVATSRSATVYNPPASTPNLGLSSVLPSLALPTLSGSLGLGGSVALSASLSLGLSASLGLIGSLPPLTATTACGGLLQPACSPTASAAACGGLLQPACPPSATTASSTSACTPQPGLLGLGQVDCSTSTTPSSSVSRTQVTYVITVTTMSTTTTVTSCSTNGQNQIVCPTVNVIQSMIGTRTTSSMSFVTMISSTLATSTARPSSSTSTRACLAGAVCL